ncbi:MAG: phage major capsid protein [Treponema sp.]|jgi:HK97 family phage major capsid protein|nr:phage major capsid protein [Treponema sp.]
MEGKGKQVNKTEQEKMRVEIELRSLAESVKGGKIKAVDAKKKLDELRARKTEIDKKIALADKPKDPKEQEQRSAAMADLSKAMREKRSITLNGTGVINQIRELAKELQAKTPILKLVRYFYGPNASTNIPVLSPTIATPGNFAEGATGVSADTQAQLLNQTVTPYAYISLLPVSAESLLLGSVNIEGELPAIFADAFGQAFHNGILTGDGTGRNFKGIFPAIPTDNKVQCAATGDPKIADLVSLALKIQDMTDDAVIIMNAAIYAKLLADATTGVADMYKEGLIRDKKIEGVNLILTSGAPSSVTAGSVVAAAGRLNDYGVGMASEITVEPLKKPGDSNTYFQATVFANGKPILDKNWYGLVTK